MDPTLVQYTSLAGIDPSELVDLLGDQDTRPGPRGGQMSDAELARHLQLEQYREWLTIQIIAAGGDVQAEKHLSMLFESTAPEEASRVMTRPSSSPLAVKTTLRAIPMQAAPSFISQNDSDDDFGLYASDSSGTPDLSPINPSSSPTTQCMSAKSAGKRPLRPAVNIVSALRQSALDDTTPSSPRAIIIPTSSPGAQAIRSRPCTAASPDLPTNSLSIFWSPSADSPQLDSDPSPALHSISSMKSLHVDTRLVPSLPSPMRLYCASSPLPSRPASAVSWCSRGEAAPLPPCTADSTPASPIPSKPTSAISWDGNEEAVEAVSIREGSAPSVAASEPLWLDFASPVPSRPMSASSRHSSEEAVQSAISRAGSILASPVPSRPISTILWYGNEEAAEALSLREGLATSVAASESPRSIFGSPVPSRPLSAMSRNSSGESARLVLCRADSIPASPVPSRPSSAISWYRNEEAVEAIYMREGSAVSVAASEAARSAFASPAPSRPISALSLRSDGLGLAPGSPWPMTLRADAPSSSVELLGEEVDPPIISLFPSLVEFASPASYVEEEEVVAAPIVVASHSLQSSVYSGAKNADNLIASSSSCVVCCESVGQFKKACHATCGHVFCRSCISTYVRRCVEDESVFPLQCCLQPIDVQHIRRIIPKVLQQRFVDKLVEYQTPSIARVYCSSPGCSLFLGSNAELTSPNDEMHCSKGGCTQVTCGKCKGPAHPSKKCSKDQADDDFKDLCVTLKWPTCPGCSNAIEHSGGCNHMTCRCAHQFCYHCTEEWEAGHICPGNR